MKKYLIPTALLLVTALSSCTKTIDEDLSGNERSLLELRVEGQMGTAIIDRDGSRATATVYILETPGFAYDRVPVKGIVVSEGASASVGNGDVLNFSNPERRARITVTSRSGHRLDWWIYLETYDPFFLGTWRIVDVKLACNQRVSGVGDGAWTTQLSSGEFGTYGLPEYDDRVTITLGEISDNELTGTLVHSAGDDGAYGNFWGVYAPYSVEAPLDMNPRLRHLLPPGESQWTLDLTTNQMKITQNNVSSTMIFGTEGNNRLFRFLLPSAAGEPGRDSFYDNMWRSSTELFYVMYKGRRLTAAQTDKRGLLLKAAPVYFRSGRSARNRQSPGDLLDTLVIFARAGVYADLVARVDEQRHADRCAGIDRGGFERVGRCGIALDARLGVGHLHVHDRGKLGRKHGLLLGVEHHLDDLAVGHQVVVGDQVLVDIDLLEGLRVHEVGAQIILVGELIGTALDAYGFDLRILRRRCCRVRGPIRGS